MLGAGFRHRKRLGVPRERLRRTMKTSIRVVHGKGRKKNGHIQRRRPWSGTRVRPHAYAHMTITQRYQALFNWIASWQQNDGTRSCMMTRD
jgi:hypothetical protein